MDLPGGERIQLIGERELLCECGSGLYEVIEVQQLLARKKSNGNYVIRSASCEPQKRFIFRCSSCGNRLTQEDTLKLAHKQFDGYPPPSLSEA